MILERATFAEGWDGFQNFTGGPPLYIARGRDVDGRTYARYTFAPNPTGDRGAQLRFPLVPGLDRVRVAFAIRLSTGITSQWKFARHKCIAPGSNLGGLFVRSGREILNWGWDVEDFNIQNASIGARASVICDGSFHDFVYDYWRNGDPTGFPSAAFWLDGQQLTGPLVADDTPGLPVRWMPDGRLNAGERRSSLRIQVIDFMGTLNKGNTTSGTCDITDVTITAT